MTTTDIRVIVSDMKTTSGRTYRMDARARSAEETRQRILDAAVAEFWERPSAELSLEQVAAHARVSVRTVIRRFGGKESLLAAAVQREMQRTAAEREAPVGDLEGAVRALVAHYERVGDQVLKMLAEEYRVDALRPIADQGRRLHRQWCGHVFSPGLVGLSPQDRRRRLWRPRPEP